MITREDKMTYTSEVKRDMDVKSHYANGGVVGSLTQPTILGSMHNIMGTISEINQALNSLRNSITGPVPVEGEDINSKSDTLEGLVSLARAELNAICAELVRLSSRLGPA